MHRAVILLAATGLLLVACSTSATTPPSTSPTHLFLGEDVGPGLIFALPLSSASVPSGTLPAPGGKIDGLCTDKTGKLIQPDDGAGLVYVYNPPVRTGATPAFTLSIANLGDCTVDPSGNVYLLVAGGVSVIPPPLSSSSTVTSTISNADIAFPGRVAVDATGNLFVGNEPGSTPNVVEFSSFGSGNTELAKFGTGLQSVEGLAIGPDGFLYVSDATTTGKIDVYKPPFSNSSTIDHTLNIATTQLEHIAFGTDGNLYVSRKTDNLIDVFAPPFTGAAITSTPASSPAGIAFGA